MILAKAYPDKKPKHSSISLPNSINFASYCIVLQVSDLVMVRPETVAAINCSYFETVSRLAAKRRSSLVFGIVVFLIVYQQRFFTGKIGVGAGYFEVVDDSGFV